MVDWNIECIVGRGGPNNSTDVAKVVQMLGTVSLSDGGPGAGSGFSGPGGESPLPSGASLDAAIVAFQKKQFNGWSNGSIAPGSATLVRLYELGLTPWQRHAPRSSETLRERICRVATEQMGKVSDSGKRPYDQDRFGWEYLKKIFDEILLEPFNWDSKAKVPYHCKFNDKDYDLTFLEGVQKAHMRIPRGDPEKRGIHWCGIFAFWVWSKAGVPGLKWSRRKGGPRQGDQALAGSSKKGAFLPGDIGVIPSGTHHFILLSHMDDRQRLVSVDGNWGNQEIVKMPGGPGDVHLRSQVKSYYSLDTAVHGITYN